MGRRNFLLHLAYDGTDFQGWQRLPGSGRSVQGAVESSLAELLGLPEIAPGRPGIEIVGAGRTDAGVHAEGQAASFHAFTSLSCAQIVEGLNASFSPDLACLACAEVDPRFHARLHATSKTYRYRILNSERPDPFLRRYSLRVPGRLDLEAMRAAAAHLVGERDFRALSNAKGEDTIRRLTSVRVEESPRTLPEEGRLVDLLFEAPGFIYNQVRIMAALLLEAGQGRLAPERAASILDGRDRAAAPGALGPFGLCLVEVRYREMVENRKTTGGRRR
jgi:pseudouridylate synthase I